MQEIYSLFQKLANYISQIDSSYIKVTILIWIDYINIGLCEFWAIITHATELPQKASKIAINEVVEELEIEVKIQKKINNTQIPPTKEVADGNIGSKQSIVETKWI